MPLLRKIHRWCGIVLAAFLVVIALSGTVAAFRGDFVRIALPAARGPSPDPASFGPALDAFVAANPDRLVSARFAPYDLAVHGVSLKGGEQAWIDAQGNVVERWTGKRGIGDWALHIHHTLLIGKTGTNITGIVGLAGIAMIISGLIIYWPMRRGFSWRVWPASLKRPVLLASHRNLALLLALPLFLQFSSGSAWAFKRIVGNLPGIALPKAPTVAPSAGEPSWTATLAAAQAAMPGAKIRAIAMPRAADKPITINVQAADDINPEGVTRINVADGKVVAVVNPADHGAGARMFNSSMGVHTLGYIGGRAGEVLLALLGVLLAAMASYGVLGWWRLQSGRRPVNKA